MLQKFSAGWVSLKIKKPGDDLLSHPGAGAVPSALVGLTALFGMGRGVSPLLESPDISGFPVIRFSGIWDIGIVYRV